MSFKTPVTLILSDSPLEIKGYNLLLVSPHKLARGDVVELYQLITRLKKAILGDEDNEPVTHLFVNGKMSSVVGFLLMRGIPFEEITPSHLLMHNSIDMKSMQLHFTLRATPITVNGNRVILSHLPCSKYDDAIQTILSNNKLIKGIATKKKDGEARQQEVALDSAKTISMEDFASVLSVVHSPWTNMMAVFGRNEDGDRIHKLFPAGDPGCYVANYNEKCSLIHPGIPDVLTISGKEELVPEQVEIVKVFQSLNSIKNKNYFDYSILSKIKNKKK